MGLTRNPRSRCRLTPIRPPPALIPPLCLLGFFDQFVSSSLVLALKSTSPPSSLIFDSFAQFWQNRVIGPTTRGPEVETPSQIRSDLRRRECEGKERARVADLARNVSFIPSSFHFSYQACWLHTLVPHTPDADSKHTHARRRHARTVTRNRNTHARVCARFLGWEINYYSVCWSLRLIPPVMDVTLCGAAKCVLEMCLELLCGTAERCGNEIITGWEPL